MVYKRINYYVLILTISLSGCDKETTPVKPELPKIKLVGVSDITSTQALFTADVIDLGNVQCLQAKGFCLSTISNDKNCPDPKEWYFIPAFYLMCMTGEFNGGTGLLTPGTKYYLRAFAKNLAGTTITDEIEFTTSN